MKTTLLFAVTVVVGLTLQAQMPAPPVNQDAAALAQLVQTNATLIKQQEATIATLDAMKETVNQIKIYSRRG